MPNRTVEEAFSPAKSESTVEVALVFTPKLEVGVNGNAKVGRPRLDVAVSKYVPLD